MATLFVRRVAVLYGVLLVLVAAGAAGADPSASSSGASARALAIQVRAPGGGGTREVTAPPDSVQFGGGLSLAGDGSVASTTASASARSGPGTATASASSHVDGLSLLGGAVTASRVVGKATATASSGRASGDLSSSYVSGLTVLGQAVGAAPGARYQLEDWGYVLTLAQGSAPSRDGYRGFVTALEVHLTADRGGLPAGSSIVVGFAEAVAQAAAVPAPKRTTPTATSATTATPAPAAPKPRAAKAPAVKREPGKSSATRPVPRRPLPSLTAKLTPGGYVFPVHGPSSFTDTFKGARAVVGWHHGEDIFAPIGAPVLAVAPGTVFSVGWNDIGGNRLWLRDENGNEFYYAHLSAFSTLAVNGARVEAGDVLGFVGTSGDAEGTPPHLHFEIHPVYLLFMGYDGVINPYPHLMAWRRLQDVRFIAGAGWAPAAAHSSRAPRPGAFLLSSSDISSARGLGAGSLRRALADPVSAELGAGAGDADASPARDLPAGER